VRVRDPFDQIDVGKRKAVLYTITLLTLVVCYAILFPTQAAVVAMILTLPAIIFLHELGHFTLAKRTGMKVTEFFVGFGPRLWSFRRGETEYGLKAIPLGGYCKVIGMTNLEDVEPADEDRTYRAKRWPAKVAMAVAGPATHFVIATVLMFSVLFFAGDYRDQRLTTTLAETAQGAQAAGLQPGDRIVAIDGTAISEWSDVRDAISGAAKGAVREPGDVVPFVVRRGERVLHVDVVLEESTDDGPKRPVAGVAPEVFVPQPGLAASLAGAPRDVGAVAVDAVQALGSMFSPSGLGNYYRLLVGDQTADDNKRFISPAGYASVASEAVKAGWVSAFGLLIGMNVFIGLLNLLPLLPFDGGHIAVASYEAIASRIRRRRVQVDVAKLMPVMVGVMAVLVFILVSSLWLEATRGVPSPF
jgi:membrane-associated protease RseP (regulator of RpoE activity)